MIKMDFNDFVWFVYVVEEGGFVVVGCVFDELKLKLSWCIV